MKKKAAYIIASGMLVLAACSCGGPEPYGAVPTKAQLEWQKMETNMFIHFGPNTFTGVEWGNGEESEDLFNPSGLDCSQWAAVAKTAGFKGIVITAKHHDGFCLWPNPYSEHTVSQSSWRDGKGDVLAELSRACREEGVKFGVYLSPWGRNDPSYGTPEYNDKFAATLRNVHENYGPVYEQWFDGANSNEVPQVYDWPLFNGTVLGMNPSCVIFSDVGPGCRWCGNERGVSGRSCWSTMETEGYEPGLCAPSVDTLNAGVMGAGRWVPSEVDVSIRPGWFWKESENAKVKSLQRLLKLYYESVGRNGLLLLNVPPDTRGRIHEADSVRLVEWRAALDEIFSENLAAGAEASASSSRGVRFKAARALDGEYDTFWTPDEGDDAPSLTIEFEEPETFNRIVLQEYIPLGQRVAGFCVDVLTAGGWYTIAEETTIGYKRILLVPETTATAVRVRFISCLAVPTINSMSIYMDNIYNGEL